MKKTALIMAGGKGERFWPRSRVTLPKQFLSLTDDGKTMIQLTVERIRPLVELEDVYIATNKNYKELVKQQLPGLPEENILCEPVGRNTAPCIGLGAVHVAKKYDDAVMIVLPSDHLIKHNDIFAETFTNACALAEEGENLVTVGITPNYPETGYGYIKYDSTAKNGESYPVQRFVEKPDLETAKSYLADGSYLWNSGMFVWRVSTILDCFKKYMPSTHDGLLKIKEAVGTPRKILYWKRNSRTWNPSLSITVLWKRQKTFTHWQETSAGMMSVHGWQSEESSRMTRTAMSSMAMLLQSIRKTVSLKELTSSLQP